MSCLSMGVGEIAEAGGRARAGALLLAAAEAGDEGRAGALSLVAAEAGGGRYLRDSSVA